MRKNKSCCTCSTLFGTNVWRNLPNDDVKLLYLRFWRQRYTAAVNFLFSASVWKLVPSKQEKWPTYNNRKTLSLLQSSISRWRFRFSSRRGFSNSLMWHWATHLSQSLWGGFSCNVGEPIQIQWKNQQWISFLTNSCQHTADLRSQRQQSSRTWPWKHHPQ